MLTNTNNDFKCDHLNIYEDNGEGSSVCAECGQTLEPTYACDWSYINKQTIEETFITGSDKISANEKILQKQQNEIELIKNLHDKWHFPYQVIEDTKNYFLKLIHQIKRKQKMQFDKKTIFAFAFQIVLSKHNCSHSIYEICNLFQITSLKQFSKLGFELQIELKPNFEDFLNRFSSNLNLSFHDKQKLLVKLKALKLPPNLRPETICALLIYNFFLQNKKPTNDIAKHIAFNCEISQQTLLNNYKKFKHLYSM